MEIEKITTLRKNDMKLAELSPLAIMVHSWNEIYYINPSAVDYLGIQQTERTNIKPIATIFTQNEEQTKKLTNFYLQICSSLQPGKSKEYRHIFIDKTNETLNLKCIQIEFDGKPAFLTFGTNITRKINQINNLANIDELTGLPNRRFFDNLLSEEIKKAQNESKILALFFIDLDDLKMINDSLGHNTGDLLIKDMGKRMKETTEDKGIVSRRSGDEFTILLNDITSRNEIKSIAKKLHKALNEPFIQDGIEFLTTASIGVCTYPDYAKTNASLLRKADTAMYKAKRNGKNNIYFFRPEMSLHKKQNLLMTSYLHNAVKNKELHLEYQPQYNIQTGDIVGAEALIRWSHPELGNVPPNVFIPIAENTGTIHEIGTWVLIESCKQNKKWQDAGFKPIVISVNISMQQLKQRDIVSIIKKALRISGLEPRYLKLEITESIMHGKERALHLINKIKKLGVNFAIDDFGTGYSSLQYLKELPIRTLKIDRSFTKELTENKKGEQVIASIITLAKIFEYDVVCEGVETIEQLQLLKQIGCDISQGFLHSKPLPSQEIEKQFKKITTTGHHTLFPVESHIN